MYNLEPIITIFLIVLRIIEKLFQLLAITIPTILFHLYLIHVEGQIRKIQIARKVSSLCLNRLLLLV